MIMLHTFWIWHELRGCAMTADYRQSKPPSRFRHIGSVTLCTRLSGWIGSTLRARHELDHCLAHLHTGTNGNGMKFSTKPHAMHPHGNGLKLATSCRAGYFRVAPRPLRQENIVLPRPVGSNKAPLCSFCHRTEENNKSKLVVRRCPK